jgi:hypothetical protein
MKGIEDLHTEIAALGERIAADELAVMSRMSESATDAPFVDLLVTAFLTPDALTQYTNADLVRAQTCFAETAKEIFPPMYASTFVDDSVVMQTIMDEQVRRTIDDD